MIIDIFDTSNKLIGNLEINQDKIDIIGIEGRPYRVMQFTDKESIIHNYCIFDNSKK